MRQQKEQTLKCKCEQASSHKHSESMIRTPPNHKGDKRIAIGKTYPIQTAFFFKYS